MALIVEDGTGVANANSYVDIDFLDAFAAARGLTIPTDDTVKEQYLLRAMDYLEAINFIGYKSDDAYSLQWPRRSVVLGGYDFDYDAIPNNLKLAQCQLVVEQEAGHPLYPQPVTSTTKGVVIERTVALISTRFASNKGIANSVGPIVFPAVQAFFGAASVEFAANLSGLTMAKYFVRARSRVGHKMGRKFLVPRQKS